MFTSRYRQQSREEPSRLQAERCEAFKEWVFGEYWLEEQRLKRLEKETETKQEEEN